MRNFLATTFVLSAKAYWIDGQHDQFSIENMFNHLRLASLLMKNDEKEAVEYFITAVEVNDPEEIMAQVRNMRMCMDLPHVNLLHAGSDEREHGDRDGQEPELGSSNNNTLGRSSENTTLNSRTTLNTTEEENDKIEQAMAEARASLRRGIRVLQSRATRYEELGDHEAAEEARRQIDDMEAMESSI